MLKNKRAVWIEKRRWDEKKPERRDAQREPQNNNHGNAIIVLLSEQETWDRSEASSCMVGKQVTCTLGVRK